MLNLLCKIINHNTKSNKYFKSSGSSDIFHDYGNVILISIN